MYEYCLHSYSMCMCIYFEWSAIFHNFKWKIDFIICTIHGDQNFLKGQCHEMKSYFDGLKNQISTFCIGADGF